MAKKIELKKGAIVFFEAEKNNHFIYLLRRGRLASTSFSPAKGENETVAVKEGDFFGLKSTLTDRPREATVQVLENSEAIVFTLPEFNEMLKKNIKLLLRLLISFSNDMLVVHKFIESKMNFGKSLISNREKILENANHYYATRAQNLAIYTYNKYLELYPESDEVEEVKNKLNMLQNQLNAS